MSKTKIFTLLMIGILISSFVYLELAAAEENEKIVSLAEAIKGKLPGVFKQTGFAAAGGGPNMTLLEEGVELPNPVSNKDITLTGTLLPSAIAGGGGGNPEVPEEPRVRIRRVTPIDDPTAIPVPPVPAPVSHPHPGQ
ncbi:MAG: hypothetical protein ISS47_06985 [Candidatus Omnitrophica bacterium]|nr:hypothetical protein [Candidatus Omnitrophota bacterium]